MMQDAAIANQDQAVEAVDVRRPPLPLRDDTILGICEGLGEDLGFNPLWLRIALSAGLLWNPVAIVAIYLGLGLIVAISRFLFPPARKPAAAAPAPAEPAAEPSEAQERTQEERELIAA